MSTLIVAAFQPHGRNAAEDDRARLFLDSDSDHLAQSPGGRPKLKIREMGSRYLFICLVRVAGEILQPRRLPPNGRLVIVSVVHLFESTKLHWIKEGETLQKII